MDILESIDTPCVSVMIFTLNEEIHLPGCLASLKWCDDVIIIDSGSTDGTRTICEDAGVTVFEHEFQGFGKQRNWAIDNVSVRHPWILVLDADERVPAELAKELNYIAATASEKVAAARIRRRFYMWGRWLKYSSLYPTWVVRLVHKDRVRYINRGHGETQQVDGDIIEAQHDLIDENLKGIDEWFDRQNRYARAEADYELHQEREPLKLVDLFTKEPMQRRQAWKRLAWRAPFRSSLYFLYSYIFRQGFRDGRDGLMFCLMKSVYQRMIVIKKFDSRKRSRS